MNIWMMRINNWNEKGTENEITPKTIPYAQSGGGWYQNQNLL